MDKGYINRLLALFGVVCIFVGAQVLADNHTLEVQRDLSFLSVEELMDVRITSVARKEQVLGDSTSAVFVLSKEDISRSGATTIPDLLRLVPGFEVAKNSSNSYAISARGFNGTFATKLLVMVDGRSVYSSLFAGVFWSSLDVLIEDIERIEVVRGPGASVWGSNAVNGVINIITSHTKDSQGLMVSARGGIEEKADVSARYGGEVGKDGFYRAYVKGYDRDGSATSSGERAFDGIKSAQSGFRVDLPITESSDYTLQGDAYIGNSEMSYGYFSSSSPFRFLSERRSVNAGVNFLQRYSKRLFENSDVSFQMYYDRIKRQEANLDLHVDTLDLDVQHRFPLERQDILWGVGQRIVYDYAYVGFPYRMNGDSKDNWFSLSQFFVQDEIEVIREKLLVTVGSRLEHNEYTSLEFQPNLRFLIRVSPEQSLWGSVARAVRIPARVNRKGSRVDLLINYDMPPYPVLYSMMGSSGFKSEVLYAYELGYRAQVSDSLSFDVSLFFNDYDSLSSLSKGALLSEEQNGTQHYLQSLMFSNYAEANSVGGEIVVDWRASEWLRLLAWYSLVDLNIKVDEASGAMLTDRGGVNPKHKAHIRAQISPCEDVDFDVMTRFVDELSDLEVDEFIEIDARLAWRPNPKWELALVGHNLLHDRVVEFREILRLETTSEIQRSIYAQASYKY